MNSKITEFVNIISKFFSKKNLLQISPEIIIQKDKQSAKLGSI